MPRYYFDGARDTTDSQKKVSIFWLNKNGHLRRSNFGNLNWSCNGEPTGSISFEINVDEDPYFRFMYHLADNPDNKKDYNFSLEAINCNYGGKRWYFRCGLNKSGKLCGRRVGVLYLVGGYFGCRTCMNLSYDSCNTNKKYRWLGKVIGKSYDIEEEYYKLRTKYYKGKPTKKLKKIINFWERIGNVDYESILVNKMLK